MTCTTVLALANCRMYTHAHVSFSSVLTSSS